MGSRRSVCRIDICTCVHVCGTDMGMDMHTCITSAPTCDLKREKRNKQRERGRDTILIAIAWTLHSSMHVCMRSHGAAHARVFTHAPARMCVMRPRSPASGLVGGAMHGGSRRVVLTCLFVRLLCTGPSMCAATHHRLGELITVRRSGTTRR